MPPPWWARFSARLRRSLGHHPSKRAMFLFFTSCTALLYVKIFRASVTGPGVVSLMQVRQEGPISSEMRTRLSLSLAKFEYGLQQLKQDWQDFDAALGATGKNSDWCISPYLLRSIPRESRKDIETAETEWVRDLADAARAEERSHGTRRGSDVYKLMMPAHERGCNVTRLGGDGDGGKLICGVGELAKAKDCVVYSLGSRDEWDFETGVAHNTACQVHTFDCTVDAVVPDELRDRVTFHKICLGSPRDEGLKIMTLEGMMQMLGHTRLSLLKMDVEGAEWPEIRRMLHDDWRFLPDQWSVELHYLDFPYKGLDGATRIDLTGAMELALAMQRIHDAGYRMVAAEDNSGCCKEFTFVRLRCPEP